jgi:hypothetical protein
LAKQYEVFFVAADLLLYLADMVVDKVAISIQVSLDLPRQSVYFISFDNALDGEVEANPFASIVQTACERMEQTSEGGVTLGAVLLLYSGATNHQPALCTHRNMYPICFTPGYRSG